MDTDYTISVDDGFIRVVYVGRTLYDTSTRMIRDIARIAGEADTQRLLIDLRQALYGQSHVSPIRHVEEAPSLGVDASYRSAILGAKKDQMILKFIEDVAVNRGYRTRVFFDEQEALAWLMGEGA